jgi:hypothetical protein
VLDVLVEVVNVDVRRAGAIRLASERARERRMLDEPLDEDLLPRLDVRADPNAQLRVALEPLVHSDDPTPRREATGGSNLGKS